MSDWTSETEGTEREREIEREREKERKIEIEWEKEREREKEKRWGKGEGKRDKYRKANAECHNFVNEVMFQSIPVYLFHSYSVLTYFLISIY